MPSLIWIGAMNASTPQQNAGLFIGEINMTGWDANQKFNQAHGGLFGILNANFVWICNNVDGLEGADGNILDQDNKALLSGNV
ncbi:MAG: hypothetical protein K6T31_06720 [Alicyclobacillus sp.]|nr:hypothetical protein [Alicyclobacillus sp.]